MLVAETNTPKKNGPGGIKGWIMGWAMNRAGAGVPSPNRIMLLRDADGDGVAETKSVFLEGLNSPFGMALVGDKLYVADTDAVLRFDYTDGATEIKGQGTKIADLPAGPLNYHWTKSLAASADGSHLYVGVGSNSNAGENGLDQEDGPRAEFSTSILPRARRAASRPGLRNPVGLAIEPQTGVLWVVVNERDELGCDLVPDYLTAVKDGAFYGWPYSYWGQHVDEPREAARSGRGGTARSRPTMRSATMWRRSGSPSRKAICCRSDSATARSSASTARGTAFRSAATRWCSCRLPAGSRRGCRSMC